MHAPTTHRGPKKNIFKPSNANLRSVIYRQLVRWDEKGCKLSNLKQNIVAACTLDVLTLQAILEILDSSDTSDYTRAYIDIRNILLAPIDDEIKRRESEVAPSEILESIIITIIDQPTKVNFGDFFQISLELTAPPDYHKYCPMTASIVSDDTARSLAVETFDSVCGYNRANKRTRVTFSLLILHRDGHPEQLHCKVRFSLPLKKEGQEGFKIHYSETIEVVEKASSEKS
jgi:hypothetical protein